MIEGSRERKSDRKIKRERERVTAEARIKRERERVTGGSRERESRERCGEVKGWLGAKRVVCPWENGHERVHMHVHIHTPAPRHVCMRTHIYACTTLGPWAGASTCIHAHTMYIWCMQVVHSSDPSTTQYQSLHICSHANWLHVRSHNTIHGMGAIRPHLY